MSRLGGRAAGGGVRGGMGVHRPPTNSQRQVQVVLAQKRARVMQHFPSVVRRHRLCGRRQAGGGRVSATPSPLPGCRRRCPHCRRCRGRRLGGRRLAPTSPVQPAPPRCLGASSALRRLSQAEWCAAAGRGSLFFESTRINSIFVASQLGPTEPARVFPDRARGGALR